MTLLGGTPFVGKHFARDLMQGADAAAKSEAGPPSWPPPNAPGHNAIEPKMPRWRAARAVLGDPAARAQAEAFFYERHRVVHFIDADIEIMRSWSPMAKIAFQRQRNVARELENMMREPSASFFEQLQSKINKLVWG